MELEPLIFCASKPASSAWAMVPESAVWKRSIWPVCSAATRWPLSGIGIASTIAEVEGTAVPTGSLDVTMYRDDLRSHPTRTPHRTAVPATGIDGQIVVLVDDVLYSGRTIRAALDALSDLGRPAAVRLAILVDRGHRELPIRADHVGKNLPTARSERVRLHLVETDGEDEVRILGTNGGEA